MGATKPSQLEDNLKALDFEISADLASQSLPDIPPNHVQLVLRLTTIVPDPSQQLQFASLALPCHCTIANPTLLHLVRLLQTEMAAPQVMSQMYVSAIVQILTTHLLHCNLDLDG